MVSSLGLFSPNEEADDISTADLKYLLTPFFLAELQAETDERDPALRKARLQAAHASYDRHALRILSHSLQSKTCKGDSRSVV